MHGLDSTLAADRSQLQQIVIGFFVNSIISMSRVDKRRLLHSKLRGFFSHLSVSKGALVGRFLTFTAHRRSYALSIWSCK